MKNRTLHIQADDIQKILLLDDGITKYMIFLFKDGTAKRMNFDMSSLTGAIDAGIEITNITEL